MSNQATVDLSSRPEPRYGNLTAQAYGALTCKYAGVPNGDVADAPSNWSAPPPPAIERRAMFEREGFCILDSVLSEEEVRSLRSEYVRLATDWRTTEILRDGYDLEPRQEHFDVTVTPDGLVSNDDLDRLGDVALPAFRKIGGVYNLSEQYKRLAHNPAVVEFMHAILGPQVFLFRDLLYPHVARVSREKPWHNDADYWLREWQHADRIVQTMTAIDPHRISNGCLQLIPRSHHQHWEHFFLGDRKVMPDRSALEKAVHIELNPGDVLVFDSRLLHASRPNASDEDRCVVYNAYCPPIVTFNGSGQAPPLIPISLPTQGDL